MEQFIVVINDSSTSDTTLSFLGWFCLFVVPSFIIATIYFGFQNKKRTLQEPLENEQLFDHLFDFKRKHKSRFL